MDNITSNLTGTVRRATVGGREYLIAPLSLIVPGVLNGSRGPLLYPEEEVRRDVSIWNGMPLTRGHPTRNGQPVSARIPEVLQEYGLGTVYNARYDEKSKKLVAEGWFDVANTQRIDPNLLDALQKGDKIELSTGLFLDVTEEGGVHNGRQYTHVSRNYRADHVAVLVNETGACSKRDGCGVNVNKESETEETVDVDNVFCATGPGGGVDPTCSKGKSVLDVPAKAGDSLKVKEGSIWKLAGKIVESQGGPFGPKKKTYEVFDKSTGITEEIGAEFLTHNQQTPTQGGDPMKRDEAIAYLTTNCDCWKEGKETLNKMTDAELSKMCEGHKASASKEKEMAANLLTANARIKELETIVTTNSTTPAQPTPKTAEEWFASAPPEVQAVVRNGVEALNREAADLIERITAPVTNEEQRKAKAEWLRKKPIEELREIASLIPETNAASFPRPYFYGAGAPAKTPVANQSKPEDVLPLPTCNWDEHSLYPANQRVAQS